MSSTTFNAYSTYYDLLYRDKNYFEECEYIKEILSKHNIYRGKILEFGSGTGMHGRILAKAGYTVHGIELSHEMVARTELCERFTCQQGDIANIKLGSKFDAVLSLFHVLSYQIDNEKIQAVFERASAHLDAGGLFVFDCWYSPAVLTQKPETRVKRITDGSLNVTRIAEPKSFDDQNRVDVRYTVYLHNTENGHFDEFTETHAMRHFTIPEIDMIAVFYGFERLNVEEFITRNKPDCSTWGVCFVLRKI